jgi:hypothetical protein
MPSLQGDILSIDGWITTALYTDYQAKRQQLLGLVDNEDEDVVPLIMTQDSTHDGFYRPISVQVDSPVGVNNNTAAKFSIKLQRLRTFAAPFFEVTYQSALRANTSGVTAPGHIEHVFWSSTTLGTAYLAAATPATTYVTLFSDDGAPLSVGVDRRAQTAFTPTPTTYLFAHRPQFYYVAGCRLELLYGATWYPVLGRSVPPVSPGGWRITNGLCRLTLGTTAAAAAALEIWNNTSSAWQATSFAHAIAGVGIGYGLSTLSTRLEVIRNSPEAVVVRHSGFGIQETFSLSRGAMGVVYTIKSPSATGVPTSHGVKFSAVTASTANVGGLRQTANDANGNQGVLASSSAMTVDLVNGKLTLTAAAQSCAIMLASSLGGSGAVAGNTPTELANQFFGVTSWRQRIVTP